MFAALMFTAIVAQKWKPPREVPASAARARFDADDREFAAPGARAEHKVALRRRAAAGASAATTYSDREPRPSGRTGRPRQRCSSGRTRT